MARAPPAPPPRGTLGALARPSDSPTPAPRPGSARSRRAAWVLLVAWTLLLAAPFLERSGPLAEAGLAALGAGGRPLVLLLRLLAWGALEALRFAPLGLLAVAGLPDRDRAGERIRRVALPALGAALGAASLAVWLRGLGSPAPVPFPVAVLLPAAGAALGTALALAWRRGRRARLLFLPRLAALGAGLLLAAAALGWLATEAEPLVPEPAPVSSEEKRRLYALLAGKNPRQLSPGEIRTVRLTGRDLERLLAWAWGIQGVARGALALEGPERASGALSARLPFPRGRWLNAAATVRGRIRDGRPEVEVEALRVGRLSAPRSLLRVLAPLLVATAASEPRVRGVLDAVRQLAADGEAVTVTFGRVDLPPGQLATVLWGEEAAPVRAAVGAQVDRLLAELPRAPRGDRRFAAALETAFGLARERSGGGSALEENRTALLALAVVLGHERVASLAGHALDERRAGAIREVREGTTVRGRADWVRHFTVSGALTVLASVAPSDAAGLFKEERDAAGGSGFSFGDLLADRAGTVFAAAATEDEAAAAAMQDRLAAGVRPEDLFPPAADLPEGIPADELESAFGGVGGARYRAIAGEIERRIAALPAYRAAPWSGPGPPGGGPEPGPPR